MRALAITVVLFGADGCRQASDVGLACPMEVPPPEPNPTTGSVSYPAVVEVNTAFPCDSLVCVALAGVPPYCSQICREDAGCPEAFECRVVNAAGPFADRRYCVWRRCRSQLECGDVTTYDCIAGYYGPNEPPGLCGPLAEEE